MRWIILLQTIVAVSADASDLLVPEQYPTIQAALNAGTPSDVISVASGIYFEHVVFPVDDLTLLSRVRHGAMIDGGGTGHVVTLNDRTGTIDGFIITHAGGGFYAGIFTSQRSQTIVHNVVTGNPGAGIVISSGSRGWIEANEIFSNGTGVKTVSGAVGTIVDNLIYANGASGIEIDGSGQHVIVNNTVADNWMNILFYEGNALLVNNVMTGGSWGIYYMGPYDPDITAYVGTQLTVHHNDFWNNGESYYALLGGTPKAVWGPFTAMPGQGEIEVDPHFVGGGDFHVLPTSPCINAGVSVVIPPDLPETDLDGNPRLVGTIDIGAYEHQASTAVGPFGAAERARSFIFTVGPNPFRSVTIVNLGVDATSDLELAVYDLAGRLVRTLVRERVSAGSHTASWDGRDEAGARVASGAYFLRLTGNGLCGTRKVVHIIAQ